MLTTPEAPPVALNWRRRLAFVLLLWTSPVWLLLAIELVLRLSTNPPATLDVLVSSSDEQANFRDREHVSIFEGDPTLFWRLKPNLNHVIWDFTVVSTNDRGLRHRRQITARTPGDIRIVCLGDSITFGYRVPVVWPNAPDRYDRNDHPWPRLLEESLTRKHPQVRVDVLALAVPGYTSHQGLAWLRRDIAELAPDVVIAQFGWNDVTLRAVADDEAMPVDRIRVAIRSAVVHSHALLRVARWQQTRPQTPVVGDINQVPRVSMTQFVLNHLAIAEVAQTHDARAVLIGPMYRDLNTNVAEAKRLRAYRQALRMKATSLGLTYIEIPELTEDNDPDNGRLFGEAIHPNAIGHRLLADQVTELLTRRRLLEPHNH